MAQFIPSLDSLTMSSLKKEWSDLILHFEELDDTVTIFHPFKRKRAISKDGYLEFVLHVPNEMVIIFNIYTGSVIVEKERWFQTPFSTSPQEIRLTDVPVYNTYSSFNKFADGLSDAAISIPVDVYVMFSSTDDITGDIQPYSEDLKDVLFKRDLINMKRTIMTLVSRQNLSTGKNNNCERTINTVISEKMMEPTDFDKVLNFKATVQQIKDVSLLYPQLLIEGLSGEQRTKMVIRIAQFLCFRTRLLILCHNEILATTLRSILILQTNIDVYTPSSLHASLSGLKESDIFFNESPDIKEYFLGLNVSEWSYTSIIIDEGEFIDADIVNHLFKLTQKDNILLSSVILCKMYLDVSLDIVSFTRNLRSLASIGSDDDIARAQKLSMQCSNLHLSSFTDLEGGYVNLLPLDDKNGYKGMKKLLKKLGEFQKFL